VCVCVCVCVNEWVWGRVCVYVPSSTSMHILDDSTEDSISTERAKQEQ